MASSEEDIRSILRVIDDLKQSVKNTVNDLYSKYNNIDIYTDIKSLQILNKSYACCLDDYTRLGMLLSKVSGSLLDIRSLRKYILTSALPPSLVNFYKRSIDDIVKDMTDVREQLEVLMKVLEARIRYYNSCQYFQKDSLYK